MRLSRSWAIKFLTCIARYRVQTGQRGDLKGYADETVHALLSVLQQECHVCLAPLLSSYLASTEPFIQSLYVRECVLEPVCESLSARACPPEPVRVRTLGKMQGQRGPGGTWEPPVCDPSETRPRSSPRLINAEWLQFSCESPSTCESQSARACLREPVCEGIAGLLFPGRGDLRSAAFVYLKHVKDSAVVAMPVLSAADSFSCRNCLCCCILPCQDPKFSRVKRALILSQRRALGATTKK